MSPSGYAPDLDIIIYYENRITVIRTRQDGAIDWLMAECVRAWLLVNECVPCAVNEWAGRVCLRPILRRSYSVNALCYIGLYFTASPFNESLD